MKHNDTGRIGENIAEEFYIANGYRILERNYHSSHKEIDIIAEKQGFIVFAEVKTRSNTDTALMYGSPASAVDKGKQKRLLAAASAYLSENEIKDIQVRMDVVEVYLSPDGRLHKLNYIRNAFILKGH